MYNLNSDIGRYFSLGRIVKTNSWRGELVFFLDVDEPADYAGLDMVFIDIRGSLVPFFIEEISLRGDTAIVKLEDVDNPTQAQRLLKCGLYLPLEELEPLKDESFYFHELTGYRAIDREHGHIGTVAEILQRTTRSTSKSYLIWKIRQAQQGKVPIGPRSRGEGVEHKVLPVRVPATAVADLDESWKRLGIKSRTEFFRRAVHAYLESEGEADSAALFA